MTPKGIASLNQDKYFNNIPLKGGATFSIRNTKMSPLKCHSLDCVPNVFKMLGITDKENSKFLASLYKKGIPEHIIYRFLNEEFKKPHLDERIYNINDGEYRKFTEIESILELKNMEEYAKSIIKNNTAFIGMIVYIDSDIRHLMVVANIENDIYLLDPQSNLSFNVSQIVRENNYTKELLRYIKRIIKISIVIHLSTDYVHKYTKPFFSELLKYSLLHGENKNPHNYLEFVSRSAPTKSQSRAKSQSRSKSQLRTKSQSRSQSNKPNLQYIDMNELKYGQKYLILPRDKNELPLTGIFHLIEEGHAIFNVDGEREEINQLEYKFVKISKKKSITRRHKSA
jgi:hypothetical protein